MANLSAADIDELSAQLQAEFSAVWTRIPVNQVKLRSGLVSIDAELESAEVGIFQGINDAYVRSWLQVNQVIGRLIIERVERKRREVL